MFETHATGGADPANLTPARVDAITDAVRQAAEHEAQDMVARADLYRALPLQTGVLIGAGIAVLRLLGRLPSQWRARQFPVPSPPR